MQKKISKSTTAKLATSILAVLVVMLGILTRPGWTAGPAKHNSASAAPAAVKNLNAQAGKNMPLVFEPNVGQTDSRVKYVARSTGYVAFLTGPSQTVLKIRNDANQESVVTMNLAGANASAKGEGIEKTAGVSNYYIGRDRSKWHEGVSNYAKVRYNGVYPGVDVVYQGDNSRFRYDFVVRAGADPNAIRLQYQGAKEMKVAANGNLVMAMPGASDYFISTQPVVYQEVGGKKQPVEATYVAKGDQASFELGAYDHSRDLVIDPQFTVGTYDGAAATKVGSTHLNAISSATAGGLSGVFVAGQTMSISYPGSGSYQGTGPDGDAVVARFNYAMTTLTWATYLGGTDVDTATGIVADSSLNAIVTGWTQSNATFPSVSPVQAGTPLAGAHIFVTKFGLTGTMLSSSLLFGNATERGLAIAIDGGNHIYLTGQTSSTTLVSNLNPSSVGFQSTNKSTTSSTNAFFINLAPSGNTYTVSSATYLGGSQTDVGNSIAVIPTGGVLVVGTTTSFGLGSSNFPTGATCSTTASSPLTTGASHGFATALGTNASCTTSWLIGSNGASEVGLAAGADQSGNLYAGGATVNETAFTQPAAITLSGTTTGAGGQDGYLIEFGGGTNAGTLVNGDETLGNKGGLVANGVSLVTGIATDNLNNVYISGTSSKGDASVVGQGLLIRRRAFANLVCPTGAGSPPVSNCTTNSPFLKTFPAQETNPGPVPAVTALGDVPLGVAGTTTGAAPAETISNGMATGVSYDGGSLNACFAGWVSQKLPPVTDDLNSITNIQSYQNNANTGVAAGTDTGLVACATFNDDTSVQITTANGTIPDFNGAFTFTYGVGGTGGPTASPTNSFSLSNPTTPGAAETSTVTYTQGAHNWLTTAVSGSTVTMSINTNVADTFNPGVFLATFQVWSTTGDNAYIPQTITVTLRVTGTLSTNDVFGAGVPMSQTLPGECTVSGGTAASPANQACTFTVTNGPHGSVFSDGNSTEDIFIPVLDSQILQLPGALSNGYILFNGAIATDPKVGTFSTLYYSSGDTLPPGGSYCSHGGAPGEASGNACYLEVTIPASFFNNTANGTYQNSLTLATSSYTSPNPGAPEDSTVTLPTTIYFNVTVSNDALRFTGDDQFSFPIDPVGNTTVTANDHLDTLNMNTNGVTYYQTTASALPLTYSCPGGTASGGPIGSYLAFSNNGVLPASTAAVTSIPYEVSVANGGGLPPGIYATRLTVNVFTDAGDTMPLVINNNPVSATKVYCLYVGNFITTNFWTPDAPQNQPPLYIEDGTTQATSNSLQSTITVSAAGTLTPRIGTPNPVNVPFSLTTNLPSFVTISTGFGCAGGSSTGGTGSTCWNINSTPTLAGAALGENDANFTVTATGSAGDGTMGADSALVNPPLPSQSPATAETFVFREQVTSGVTLQYWTDFSQYSYSATSAPGNYVTESILAGEAGGPFLTDPILTITNPGTGTKSPDWTGLHNSTINLKFYTVLGSGVFTMQDGTPAGWGADWNTCDGFEALPCQNVQITASGSQPTLFPHFFSFGPQYTFQSVAFLEDPGPDTLGCGNYPGNFGPPNECHLTSEINPTVSNLLGIGTYYASYTINVLDRSTADTPQPSPVTVNVTLDVTTPPTITPVTSTGSPANFTYTVGFPATVPGSVGVTLTADKAAGPVGFTMTPSAGPPTVLLSLNGGTPSNNPINGCINGNHLTDCHGNAITIAVSIGNLNTLTTPGSFNGSIAVVIPPTNPVTGLINATVTDPSFTLPVNVTVLGASVTTSTTTLTIPSTPLGSANPSVTFTLDGSGLTSPIPYTITSITSTPAWLVVSPTSGNVNNGTGTVITVSADMTKFTGTTPASYTGSFLVNTQYGTTTVNVNFATTTLQCAIALGPVQSVFGMNGTSTGGMYPSVPVSMTVTVSGQCQGTWTALSSAPWVVITSGTTGTGNGTVTFNVFSNTHTSMRTANIQVAFSDPATTQQVALSEAGSTNSLLGRQITFLYQATLGREPDSAGYTFWLGQGGLSLGQMTADFLDSPEGQATDFQMMAMYQAITGSAPAYQTYLTALQALRSGTSAATLFNNLLAGTSLTTPVSQVTAIYGNLLGRSPTSAEITAGEALAPYTLFYNLYTGAEFESMGSFHTDHSNSLYVTMLYYLILERAPDPAGFTFWLGVANGGGAGIYYNSVPTQLLILGNGPSTGFTGSTEFTGGFNN